jgi:putative heme iron utilization protein
VTAAPPPELEIRRLIRGADRGYLATLLAGQGVPYASLVLVAADHDASPLLFMSGLAEHTKNLLADDRASLLIDGTAGLADPLTGARATLVGRVAATAEPRHRARYLARHPKAEMYAGFGDFHMYRLAVERVHIVAGFGRIRWIDGAKALDEPVTALIERESDIVGHMNQDHADALDLYATRLLGRSGTGWRMTGIDPEGADLRREGEVARLAFACRVLDAEAARAELVRLVRDARARSTC